MYFSFKFTQTFRRFFLNFMTHEWNSNVCHRRGRRNSISQWCTASGGIFVTCKKISDGWKSSRMFIWLLHFFCDMAVAEWKDNCRLWLLKKNRRHDESKWWLDNYFPCFRCAAAENRWYKLKGYKSWVDFALYLCKKKSWLSIFHIFH